MTWIELHDLSETLVGASPEVMRHGVAAALQCDDAQIRTWISSTRGLSAYALCTVLDQHGVPVPVVAITAVRDRSTPDR